MQAYQKVFVGLTRGRNEMSSVLGLRLRKSSSADCPCCAITMSVLYCRSYT